MATVTVRSGRSARLALDCRVRGRWVVRGRATGAPAPRTIALKPRHGRLTALDRRGGTVRYVPAKGFAGSDTLRFTLVRGGRLLRGTIRIRVVRATTPAPAKPAPTPAAPAPAL
ncbi:Ig-like domain-containing protein, partial [Conexibacter stalactiti]